MGHPWGNLFAAPGKTTPGGMNMKKKDMDEIRIDPEQRLCSKFDSTGIAKFRVADRDEMGVRVVDDCAEEHIM